MNNYRTIFSLTFLFVIVGCHPGDPIANVSENLSAFDPAGSNIFYCYTGQTAAASIAYLTVIGYDVKSIKFGFNNMYYSELPGHKWPKPFGY